ncbi:MAG: hypothetical protein GWP75_08180 [Planctomycetia bacterium]|nr:hypothetical protein [Planctomycetia bacterium]
MYYNYTSGTASNAAIGSRATSFAQSGILNFSVDSINSTSYTGWTIPAFCVEIEEGLSSPITYNIVDPATVPENSPPGAMGAGRTSLINDLYSKFYVSTIENPSGSWSTDFPNAQAFQLLIWEISHENFSGDTSDSDAGRNNMMSQINLLEGAFVAATSSGGNSLASNVSSAISTMTSGMGVGGWGTFARLAGATNATNQDLLIVVPSPAIAGLAGLGLVGMRRRRR